MAANDWYFVFYVSIYIPMKTLEHIYVVHTMGEGQYTQLRKLASTAW